MSHAIVAWSPRTLAKADSHRELRMMRSRLLALFFVMLSLTGPVSAQQTPVRSDQEILIELERSWNEAFYKQDLETIERLLADEFIATYEDGSRGDKARELALARDFNQQVESAIQDDFIVKIYRDTAVVWFTLRLTGVRQGQRTEIALSYTDVWIIRDGRWQCVSTQSTRVSQP